MTLLALWHATSMNTGISNHNQRTINIIKHTSKQHDKHQRYYESSLEGICCKISKWSLETKILYVFVSNFTFDIFHRFVHILKEDYVSRTSSKTIMTVQKSIPIHRISPRYCHRDDWGFLSSNIIAIASLPAKFNIPK